MTPTEEAIAQTQRWIKSVVIDCNFCPFASKVYNNQTIHYSVSDLTDQKDSLSLVSELFELLDEDPKTETAFLIFTGGFKDFNEYLSLVKKADRLLVKEDYEGIYQVASFHPGYCFQGAGEDDPANYTNRSPYPMLHFLREESVEKALKFFTHPETIPENNVAFAREKGLPYMQMLLSACR
jgi:hypothetical protein